MGAVILRRLNRIFALLIVGWAVFCLFVQPVLMAREAKGHYDRDQRSCYAAYGSAGTLMGR
jgi:hypothetical protein